MTPPTGASDHKFSVTFNIESLRLAAYSALVFMVGVGIVVTKLFVHDDPEHTVIYRIFGFNHICNVFDHQPSRTVSGILILFFIVPMACFVVLSHLRTADAARRGRVPAWLLRLVAVWDKTARLAIQELGKRQDLSNARARTVLGWQPRHADLERILADAWAWERRHAEWSR